MSAEPPLIRVPPHDRDAERAVIGTALADNATILDVASLLRPEDFYVYAHQIVWKAMTQTYLDKSSVDAVGLANKIKGMDAIEDVGGFDYIFDLEAEAYTGGSILHHAEIVRSFALRRGLIQLSRSMQDDADDRQKLPEETVESCERKLFGMVDQGRRSQAEPVSVAVRQAYERIEARKKKKTTEGVTTGWTDVDKWLGYLENGALIIVASRPGVGKTAFACNLAWNVSRRGDHVFITSLEMAKIELGERLLAMQTEINSYKFRQGTITDSEMYGVDDAVLKLEQLPITIDDAPCQGVLNIASTTRRSKIHNGTKLVLIDYLQLIQPEPGVINRQEQVAGISRRLKLLARELQAPVVCLAQVNRQSESRADGRIKMSDLRESGAIEQDADVIILLQKDNKKDDEPYTPTEDLEVEIAKNRNGPTGSAALTFAKETLRVYGSAAGDF